MGFDGLDADLKLFGNLGSVFARTDQLEDAELAGTEPCHHLAQVGLLGLHRLLAEHFAHVLAYVASPIEDGSDRIENGPRCLLLHNIPHGPCPDGSLGVETLVMHGENKHR